MHLLRVELTRQARGVDHVAEEDAEQPEVRARLAHRLGRARPRPRVGGNARGLLLLRLDLGFLRLGLTQRRDGRKHDFAVTKRDAEFLQISAVQIWQDAKVDIVRGEGL